MPRRALIRFTAYGLVAVIHLVLGVVGLPGELVTKWLLMPVLLAAVLFEARVRSRARLLLSAGIAASWAGDVLLGVSFVAGLTAFAWPTWHTSPFVGPARTRRLRWDRA